MSLTRLACDRACRNFRLCRQVVGWPVSLFGVDLGLLIHRPFCNVWFANWGGRAGFATCAFTVRHGGMSPFSREHSAPGVSKVVWHMGSGYLSRPRPAKIFIIFGINHHIYSSSPPGLTASWYLDCLPCNQWLFRGTKPRVHTRANPFCRWPERGQILWSGGEGRLSNGCGWGFSQRETKQWTVLDGGLWCFACIRQERCELVRACAFSCFFGGLSAFLFAKWQTHSRQTRLGSSSNDQHLEDSCAHGRTALKKRWNWWNVWRSTVQSDLAALVLMVLSTFVIPFFPIAKFDCHNCSKGILCFLGSQIGDLQN